MAKTVFSAGDGVTPLEFSANPAYLGKVVLHTGLNRTLTEGGEEYVYGTGPSYALHFLKFEGLPAWEFDGGFDYAARAQEEGTQSLVNWFYNVSSQGQGAFTYKDAYGKEHTVTIADDRLEFSMTEDGRYDGIVTLKETLG